MKTYKYIGGLRNQDGAVTWTSSVLASGPEEAKRKLAAKFSERTGRYVKVEEVGIVRRPEFEIVGILEDRAGWRYGEGSDGKLYRTFLDSEDGGWEPYEGTL